MSPRGGSSILALDLAAEMNDTERRAWLHLGRLYLERRVAPTVAIYKEVARMERAIEAGEVPDAPRTQ